MKEKEITIDQHEAIEKVDPIPLVRKGGVKPGDLLSPHLVKAYEHSLGQLGWCANQSQP